LTFWREIIILFFLEDFDLSYYNLLKDIRGKQHPTPVTTGLGAEGFLKCRQAVRKKPACRVLGLRRFGLVLVRNVPGGNGAGFDRLSVSKCYEKKTTT
jgi:hypothetical protein